MLLANATGNEKFTTRARIATLELAAKAAWKLHPGAPVPGEPWLVHTRVGLKYVGRGFASPHFARYVTRTLDTTPEMFSWDDLVLPPDLLRDEYTHTGKPVMESPHFRLMRELRDDTGGKGLEYARLCATGALDARRAFALDAALVERRFTERTDELAARRELHVFVFAPRRLGGRDVYVIADGKHGAALAALSGDTRVLRLHVLSDDVLAHRFFRKIYDAVMAARGASFSINRRMVKLLRHE